MKAQTVKAGTWVQVETIVFEPEERTGHLPEDTRQVPLQMWVKGYLKADGEIGEVVSIETAIGRELQGKLIAVNPPYVHTFGRPVPELLPIGNELRKLISGGQQ